MMRAAALALALLCLAGGAGIALASRTGDGAPAGSGAPPGFVRGQLDFTIDLPTSLALGPDGRLYVAGIGEIHALTLDPVTKDVLADELIADGLDDVLGIAFDPTAPASPVVLYASHRDASRTDGLESVVSRFTAPDWTRENVITGLPTSRPYLNHATNALAFDANGRLYISQGSVTDAGVSDPPGKDLYWRETPLSAALLTADIHAPGFNGNITYTPAGPPLSDALVQVSGDVHTYAVGTRNAYDFVLHSNGMIYATDNGAFGKVAFSSCDTTTDDISPLDELNLIEAGNYYGHPSRNRGLSDARQCVYRKPEDGDGGGATGPIAVLPAHCSCDGLVEYTAAAGGIAPGDLLMVSWTLGRLYQIRLSPDGRATEAVTSIADGFDQSLDVTAGPDGTIYVAEFGRGRIAYLQPDPPLATPTATPSPTGPAQDTPTLTATATPVGPTSTPTPVAASGDVSCDGRTNSIDASLVLQLAAGLIGTLPCPLQADVNRDGETDAVDASLILQLDAGLIDSLPV